MPAARCYERMSRDGLAKARDDRRGMQGYSVRVRPSHPEACDLLGTGLVTWWQGLRAGGYYDW